MLATTALAQVQAPTFSTALVPPPANQAFTATFSHFWHPTAFGIDPVFSPIDVADDVVTVPFDLGCGFICPGGMAYYSSEFSMPALPAGFYRVRFIEAGSTRLIAEFNLPVGAVAASSAPTLSAQAALALILLLAAIVQWRRRQISTLT